MDENKKSVKRVLVLDEEGFYKLSWLCETFNSVAYNRLVGLLANPQRKRCNDDIQEKKEEILAEIFFKAYGKEVAE